MNNFSKENLRFLGNLMNQTCEEQNDVLILSINIHAFLIL